jgi:ACT domain-containing protein
MNKSKSISKTKNKNLSLTDTEQNSILDTTINGGLSIDIAKELQISLMTFYKYLEQNPNFKSEYEKAQEIGIRTLVEKMLKIFDTDPSNIEPNELLFIREKKDWLKWLAPRISSLFQEKQKIDVKTDSNIKISWSSNDEDLIDVTEDIIDIPSVIKD